MVLSKTIIKLCILKKLKNTTVLCIILYFLRLRLYTINTKKLNNISRIVFI